MKTIKIVTALAICFLLTNCGSESEKEEEKENKTEVSPETEATINAIQNATPDEEGSYHENEIVPIEPGDSTNMVKSPLAQPYLRKATPQTFTGTYQGAEFGDYYHLSFEAENGDYWDFGHGKNDLGKFDFLGDVESEKAKELIGTKYLVTWDSIWNIYPCCEGGMDPKASFMPSITKVEAISK
jgi:hypothetical protein